MTVVVVAQSPGSAVVATAQKPVSSTTPVAGAWRISHTGYERRTYEAQLSLKDLPSFKLTS